MLNILVGFTKAVNAADLLDVLLIGDIFVLLSWLCRRF
jgi:hypothetical protein